MKLLDWVKENCINVESLSRKLGVSAASLHNYLYKNREPKLRIALLIEQITDYKVQIKDLLNEKDSKSNLKVKPIKELKKMRRLK